ncbi:MAG TPA: hypothetical protein VHG91_11375 [Longimicrobium sp.]|nr:hypothetical protein [Longimicrobium sp.]
MPTDVMDEALDLLAEVEAMRPGYLRQPLPAAADAPPERLARLFAGAPPEARAQMSGLVTQRVADFLLAFAERMASLAVRERSPDRLRLGLAAVALEDFRYDSREDLLVLAPLYHAAGKIGADPRDLFDEAAALAPGAGADGLRSFLRHRDLHRILDALGYRESADADGFRYERTW